MGLLSLGTPLDWHDAKQFNDHVRDNAIEQLKNIFAQHGDREHDHYWWGDEVEYMLIDVDDEDKTAKLAIDKDYVLTDLSEGGKSAAIAAAKNVSFHPEYGRYMLEATPAKPYDGDCVADYVYVEKNMVDRRLVSQNELPPNVVPLTLTTFPRMGCVNFTSPPAKPIGPASQSLFLPDEIINRHARFPTLTANIRKRKGHKVAMNLPMYPDIHTKLMDDSIPRDRGLFRSDAEPRLGAALPGHVYMDSMGFGMGSSCIQVTMQASDIGEARALYDALAPITPIMLALSAAAPMFKGYLVNQDVRWNVICGAVDDRTFLERGVEPYPGYQLTGGLDIDHNKHLTKHASTHTINENGDISNLKTRSGKPIQRIPKSRYDSIDQYLGDGAAGGYFTDEFNDINPPINKKVYDALKKSPQIDHLLAQHFAHLFIRDPLVIFAERVDQDNTRDNDHFENLQSTNWQSLRFKPPALYPEGTDLTKVPGWRVEFRPMDLELTDFENAAYSTFIVLLSKAIIKFRPNFYIPISKIETNMEWAHGVDAVLNQKFWFKSLKKWNLSKADFIGYGISWFDRFLNSGNDAAAAVYLNGYSRNGPLREESSTDEEAEVDATVEDYVDIDGNDKRYTIDEIINGTDKFPGLIKLAIRALATEVVPDSGGHCNSREMEQEILRIKHYFMLISYRASGKIPTTAHWLREYVVRHPAYKRDSKVSQEINYDLVKLSQRVTEYDPTVIDSLLGDEITSYLTTN
ncbi:glutamate--cysteine ligase [Diutina catenulata]